jgi:3-hydroxyacyl-[acyl-carrier-protein] dehydratase
MNCELYKVIEETDNTVRIQLNPDSEIFRAHFPGNPVTPGVCQVGIIGELAEKRSGKKLDLSDVKVLKFIDILRPSNELVEIVFDKLEEDDNLLTIKGTVASEGRVYTKFSLIFKIVS